MSHEVGPLSSKHVTGHVTDNRIGRVNRQKYINQRLTTQQKP